ncbi:creatininase family protein [Halococcus dombrowskii]|uniref:Creatininase family protein n=1 Tax=Halococcus dombrowskii TaxID=179637 RepID=A0AAV3SN44_HALDO|nr:creatininase family protein [Halococcus dombrowskii]UOO95876.1 creatininase family protein [Halococcus dombrowskii]
MQLTEATWTDADGLDTELALLPVGSTEQHGPHAPLGTDRLTARAVARSAADVREENGKETVVAPAIPVGIAEEHRQFTGTLWVSPDSFRKYVRDVLTSLASHGWRKIVVVNGHGGNVGALREVCADVTRHEEAYAVPFTWFDAIGATGMGHGGPVETAMLRATDPEFVHDDRVEEASAGTSDGWGEWVSGTNLAFDSAEFTDNGAVGDPGEGTIERGEELLEEATAALVTLLDAVDERDRRA